MEKLVVFEKKHQREDNKGEFSTYYGVVCGTPISIGVKFTNECKTKLSNDKKLDKFPKTLHLEKEDYFITVDEYVDADNKAHAIDVVVIKSYQDITEPELEKKTLTDYASDKMEDKEVDKVEVEELDEDLPF